MGRDLTWPIFIHGSKGVSIKIQPAQLLYDPDSASYVQIQLYWQVTCSK